MLLATRCPFCESVFRLRPAQLAPRRGLVRCGHCQEVFDASISLFETDESGNFATAEPLEPDVVSRLIAGEAVPSERRPPVTLPFSGPALADPLSSEPYLADPRSTGLQASEPHPAEPHFAQPPGAESQLAESHPAGHSSSEPLAAGQTSAPKTAAPHDALADDATQTSHDPHAHEWTQGAPNFKSDAWNPWTPAPDAHIDERLRHSTNNLPYRPLSETAMASLNGAIEREAQQRAVEEVATHVPESGSPTEHEPALSSTANEPNTPHTPPRWRAVEPPPEEQAEPAFAFVPAMASAP